MKLPIYATGGLSDKKIEAYPEGTPRQNGEKEEDVTTY